MKSKVIFSLILFLMGINMINAQSTTTPSTEVVKKTRKKAASKTDEIAQTSKAEVAKKQTDNNSTASATERTPKPKKTKNEAANKQNEITANPKTDNNEAKSKPAKKELSTNERPTNSNPPIQTKTVKSRNTSPAQGNIAGNTDKIYGKDAKGRTLSQGKKGGIYYINANGNKEYIKKDN